MFSLFFADPDITKGDGIYTRYVPQKRLLPGSYELTVTATHNHGKAKVPTTSSTRHRVRIESEYDVKKCCGSVISYNNVMPTAPFTRKVPYGMLSIDEKSSEVDTYPPSRIFDLRTNVNKTTHSVTLKWSAPGDDYDWGKASFYEAILADSWANARDMKGVELMNLPSPMAVPHEHSMDLTVDRYDQLHYVAIRAVDAAGNKGKVGNIATFLVPHPPTTPPSPYLLYPTKGRPSIATEPHRSSISPPLSLAGVKIDVGLVAGVLTGLMLVMAIAIIACVCFAKRRKHSPKNNPDFVVPNRNIIIKSSSTATMNKDDSHDSADSTVKDSDGMKPSRPLSPVQSWAASKLLAEHEKRFSVTSGPNTQNYRHNMVDFSASMQDPFPDVTLTGAPYPSSQTMSTTQSDPPAYQTSYPEGCMQYPYQYHHGFSQDDLPPYSDLSPQSSHASTAYTHEIPQPAMGSDPDQVPYQNDMPAFVSDSYNISTPRMYTQFLEDHNLQPIVPMRTSKIPPPIAPKPNGRAPVAPPVVPISHTYGNSLPHLNSSEPKRRNVTQV